MVTFIFILAVFAATATLGWLLMQWASRGIDRHRRLFESEAGQGLTEMFLFLDPARIWGAGLVSGGLLAMVVLLSGGPWWVALLSVGLALVPLQTSLRWLRRHRLGKLDEQLPDLLLALAGALRAGTGIQSALQHVSQHIPAPLAHELALIQREQRMGVPLEQALHGFAERVPTEGARLVVSALRIAMQTGGSLAQTLERIASTLRSRLYLQGRVRALTAQGRMQAWVMAVLPVVLAAVLTWLDPEAMEKLWTTPSGWMVVGLVVVLEVAGLFLIRRIVSITV